MALKMVIGTWASSSQHSQKYIAIETARINLVEDTNNDDDLFASDVEADSEGNVAFIEDT